MNITSDKKGLVEILALFLDNCSKGTPILSQNFACNGKLLKSLINIIFQNDENLENDLNIMT